MLFHECSEYIYEWMEKQQHVKEESLTDWLLYYVSQKCNSIYYQAFSRHEEAQNGSDWEWWILTSSNDGIHRFNAYRFLVQAKKLLPNGRDNFSVVGYGNKYGLQIDLLMDFAKKRNALPVYMYYSTEESNIIEQIKNIKYIDKAVLGWCQNCNNGCYLSMASDVYGLLFSKKRKRIVASDLLNHSFKLSILDLLLGNNMFSAEVALETFNDKLVDEYCDFVGKSGIKYNEESIPHYLSVFINNIGEKLNWFEDEMKITDISGLGIIDLRE